MSYDVDAQMTLCAFFNGAQMSYAHEYKMYTSSVSQVIPVAHLRAFNPLMV